MKRLLDLFEREIPTLPILDLIANILLLVDNDDDDGCCNASEWSCWWCFGKDTVEVVSDECDGCECGRDESALVVVLPAFVFLSSEPFESYSNLANDIEMDMLCKYDVRQSSHQTSTLNAANCTMRILSPIHELIVLTLAEYSYVPIASTSTAVCC